MGLPCQRLVGSVPLRLLLQVWTSSFHTEMLPWFYVLGFGYPWQSLLLPSVSAHPDHQVSIFC